jgi:hypothetical protein
MSETKSAQPWERVFETILANATRLCSAEFGILNFSKYRERSFL